jgi:hypothetical protein
MEGSDYTLHQDTVDTKVAIRLSIMMLQRL